MRRKPWTSKELFDEVYNRIEKKGLVPEGLALDYALGSSMPRDIVDYEWDPVSETYFGGVEGIYTDIFLKGQRFDDCRLYLGCIKTLGESKEDYRKMAALGAEYCLSLRDMVEECDYIDFSWTGTNVQLFTYQNPMRSIGFTSSSDSYIVTSSVLSKYQADYALVTDMATRKTKIAWVDEKGDCVTANLPYRLPDKWEPKRNTLIECVTFPKSREDIENILNRQDGCLAVYAGNEQFCPADYAGKICNVPIKSVLGWGETSKKEENFV